MLIDLGQTTFDAAEPALSPDRTRVAFARADDYTGSWRGLTVVNVDGTGLRTLVTADWLYVRLPMWSPDGSSIAFTRGASLSVISGICGLFATGYGAFGRLVGATLPGPRGMGPHGPSYGLALAGQRNVGCLGLLAADRHFVSQTPTRRPAYIARMVPRLWTVGHSTQSLDRFLGLLATHDIEVVADVRRYPGSRRWPHFAREALAEGLAARGLDYDWFPELGGRRPPRATSANTAWRSAGFRGYADYMATESFAAGLARLADLGCGLRTAIMCAEAVWWRCHRALIADGLRWAGFEVYHILGLNSAVLHPYTSAARITGGLLSYAARGAA